MTGAFVAKAMAIGVPVEPVEKVEKGPIRFKHCMSMAWCGCSLRYPHANALEDTAISFQAALDILKTAKPQSGMDLLDCVVVDVVLKKPVLG